MMCSRNNVLAREYCRNYLAAVFGIKPSLSDENSNACDAQHCSSESEFATTEEIPEAAATSDVISAGHAPSGNAGAFGA